MIKQKTYSQAQGNPVSRFLSKYFKDNGAILIGLVAIMLLL